MRLIVALVDCLLWVLAASIGAIATTGGGAFVLGGLHVNAHSIGNPLAAILVLALVRRVGAPAVPFPASRVTPQSLELRSLRFVDSTARRLKAVSTTGAWRYVLVLSMIVLAIKMAILFSHPGFITGDDVEIQEMTIGRVLGRSWPVWDLRSAVYPMTVVYPVQWIAHAFGTTDIGMLVSAGRAAAATLSSALLAVLIVAVRRAAGMPAALLAVTLASSSHLLMAFGASELPRPVATVLVVAGFACVLGRTAGTALAGGVLVGIAATLRFTEVLFIVPAVVQFALERRWQHAAMFTVGAVATAGAIQITGDLLFWGQPFHSLINIVDYTLVQRQSSRGFQRPWEYASMTSWTDPVIVVLAVIGTSKRTRAVALWAWIPVVMLSALPHKEARYLLPVVPFVVTLAAIAVWELARRVLVRAQSDRIVAGRMALAVCVAIAASLTYQISRFHVRRSDDAVRLARALADEGGNGGLAVEQLWRLGGRLYLARFSPLIDVDPSALTRGGAGVAAEDASVQVIALRADTCARLDCVAPLAARGFAERTAPVRSDYRLFAREREGAATEIHVAPYDAEGRD